MLIRSGQNMSLMKDLLQRSVESMFDNTFIDQHKYDSFKPSKNKSYNMLGFSITIYSEGDVNDEVILLDLEVEDTSRSIFIVCYVRALNHRYLVRDSDLMVK
jgi:phosphate uptake regulator